jgi:hypothetical protein
MLIAVGIQAVSTTDAHFIAARVLGEAKKLAQLKTYSVINEIFFQSVPDSFSAQTLRLY